MSEKKKKAQSEPPEPAAAFDRDRLMADLHSPDAATRARAARQVCPCRLGLPQHRLHHHDRRVVAEAAAGVAADGAVDTVGHGAGVLVADVADEAGQALDLEELVAAPGFGKAVRIEDEGIALVHRSLD